MVGRRVVYVCQVRSQLLVQLIESESGNIDGQDRGKLSSCTTLAPCLPIVAK